MAVTTSGTSQKFYLSDFELLDRDSELINEDGSRDELDPESVQSYLSALGLTDPTEIRNFLRELTNDWEITSLEDLAGESLSSILEGIF